MTTDERADAVAAYGFTERQATFLTAVMRHSGVCVQRQYCAFAGVSRGQVIRNFFGALVDRKFATAHPCARQGALVYHIHHKGLYRAIGEPDSRCRRRSSLERAIERLMLLDVVLSRPSLNWLATEREKVTYFLHRRNVNELDLPRTTFGSTATQTTRFFIDRLPIGVGVGDDVTFLYLVTEPTGSRLREFLESHFKLFCALPNWRLLLVLPPTLRTAESAHRRAIADLCAAPVSLDITEEFRWYCMVRRSVETGGGRRLEADVARFSRARRAFGSPRFFAVYRQWIREGDAATGRLLSPAFHDAWRTGRVAVESLVLPYVYAELGSLVQSA